MPMPKQMFVALKGEHVDGHDFVLQACQQGAVAILAEKAIEA
jgi:UDP-N-acetylmuramyl pentapeptide synthase